MQGGWGFFKKQTAGEILLRLTYKAYVEDEEDDGVMELGDSDVSDDEILEYEQASDPYGESKIEKERESFMDVLAALLVSEEFQGIVASETGFSGASEEYKYPESPMSRTRGRSAENPLPELENNSEGPRGIMRLSLLYRYLMLSRSNLHYSFIHVFKFFLRL